MDHERRPKLPENLWSLPVIDGGLSSIVVAIDEFSVIKTPHGGEDNLRELELERQIYKRLGEHPRIVKVLYTHKDMLVLERLVYPLRVRISEIRDKGQVPSTEEILKWSAQAAEGMQHLHEKNVLIVDVGLQNLLLDWDDNIKYCDFSGSSLDGGIPGAGVSPHARHPNTVDDEPTIQTELFSLGCILHEIASTRKVYEELDEFEFQGRFARGAYPATEHLLLGPVILRCWRGDYEGAGEIAAEIRSIQRKTLLGDMKTSVPDLLKQKKAQRHAAHRGGSFLHSLSRGRLTDLQAALPDPPAIRMPYLPPLLLLAACLLANRTLRSALGIVANRFRPGAAAGT